MALLIYSSLTGLIYGLLLFLIAAGLTLVFGMMGIINFAHTSFYMLGAYFAYVIAGILGFWPALVIAPILVTIIGVILERTILRKVHQAGHGQEMLTTFGLVIVMEELVRMIFGNRLMDYAVPPGLRFTAFTLSGVDYPFYRVFVALVGLVLFAVLFALLRFTRTGILIRAAVRRPDMTEALGHNVSLLFSIVFGIGAWMAGVAGVVGGPLLTTSPEMGVQLAILVFVVVVIGGLGSLEGALYASLLIGVLSFIVVGIDYSIADILSPLGIGQFLRDTGGLLTTRLSSFSSSIPIILMLLVLLLRPAGLRGDRI